MSTSIKTRQTRIMRTLGFTPAAVDTRLDRSATWWDHPMMTVRLCTPDGKLTSAKHIVALALNNHLYSQLHQLGGEVTEAVNRRIRESDAVRFKMTCKPRFGA